LWQNQHSIESRGQISAASQPIATFKNRAYFLRQNVFTPSCFTPKNFYAKNFLPQIVLRQLIFLRQNYFFTPKFFYANSFTSNFLHKKSWVFRFDDR